jgi:thioredoxin 1
MKTIAAALIFVTLMMSCALAAAAEVPFDQTQFTKALAVGAPVAVDFHADWCPVCRAQAPLLKNLVQMPEFQAVTLYVANFDTEKALKRSLSVNNQSTIVVFKGGKEVARSTGDTDQGRLAALLRHATS